MAEVAKNPASEPETQTGDPTGAEGQKPEGEGQKPEEGQKEGKTFTQADLDRIVQERLEREQKKAERAAEKARKEAEDAALEKQAEWQQLAQKRQVSITDLEGRVAELEPFQEKATRYEKALANFAQDMMEGVPDHIKALLKGMDVVDQIEWYTANKEALGQKKDVPNLPQTPKPADGQKMTEDERRKKAYRVSF